MTKETKEQANHQSQNLNNQLAMIGVGAVVALVASIMTPANTILNSIASLTFLALVLVLLELFTETTKQVKNKNWLLFLLLGIVGSAIVGAIKVKLVPAITNVPLLFVVWSIFDLFRNSKRPTAE